MNKEIIKLAKNDNQTFALVKEDFIGSNGKKEYAIKYSVGTVREGYLEAKGNQIKTWKTSMGVTRAWLKLLEKHNAVNV